MRVAISTEGSFVSAHFGRCPFFTIIDIEGNKLVKREVIDNPGHHPSFLPEFLRKKEVKCIIAGGMGQRAMELFREAGIKAVTGIQGNIDDAINQILDGTLKGEKSLCNPGSGRGYGVDRTDATIEGRKYIGGRKEYESDRKRN